MNTAGPATHRHTPTLQAFDARGLKVRDVAYLRLPDDPQTTSLITRHRHDARGFALCSSDPRLHGLGLWNVAWHTDLAGQVLCTRSSDSGLALVLHDAARRPSVQFSHIDVREDGSEDHDGAVVRTWTYEEATLRGRPLSVIDQAAGDGDRVGERFVYAGSGPQEQMRNLAGQCVEHHDPVGVVTTEQLALGGGVLALTRHLFDGIDERHCTTVTRADATGAPLSITDAAGHRQRFAYDLAGQLAACWLTIRDAGETRLAGPLTYNAAGNRLREVHGNGVEVNYRYDASTQRLGAIRIERPPGHPLGAELLQELHYEYDPKGNVTRVLNQAESPRFWRNQRILPENTCLYDSLCQLVRSTGREMAITRWQGASATVLDGDVLTAYIRDYRYDHGGNLTQIRHHSPAAASYTTDITVSDRSCRAVLETLASSPQQVNALFTAAGGQRWLHPGQPLQWTPRAELRGVALVSREDGTVDSEHYGYDADSQRLFKHSVQSVSGGLRSRRVVYLPGLELRATHHGEVPDEALQVICVGGEGRIQVRVLHWQQGKPAGIDNDQFRYSYTNLTGSCGLELDGQGALISSEEFYPYGGTAVWTARNAMEASYKTLRYSGKERDATGLYYFGYRYYQPWAGRWLSTDPAGRVDGLNLYRMVGNNPVSFFDVQGLMRRAWPADESSAMQLPWPVLASGLAQFSSLERHQVTEALQEASDILTKVIQPRPLPAEEMQVWFGPGSSLIAPQVVRTWEAIGQLASEYATPYPGHAKFHRIQSGVQGSTALVIRNENAGRMFIDDMFFSGEVHTLRACTLMHELSHLRRVANINAIGPGTQDFFYLSHLNARDHSDDSVNRGKMVPGHFLDRAGLFNEIAMS
ncbi:RHS repeat-associated core domain-containing protein, partial [Pseudomonas japonica]